MKITHKSAIAAILMAAPLAACGQSGEKATAETTEATKAVSNDADDAAEQAMKAAEVKTDDTAKGAADDAAANTQVQR